LYPYRPAGGGEGPAAPQMGGRPPAAPLPGGRGQDVIKIYVLSHGGPYRPAGGRQAPTPNIKAEVHPPRSPHTYICSKQHP